MAETTNNRFIPVFEGRSVKASVTAMDGNVVTVKFALRTNGSMRTASMAASAGHIGGPRNGKG